VRNASDLLGRRSVRSRSGSVHLRGEHYLHAGHVCLQPRPETLYPGRRVPGRTVLQIDRNKCEGAFFCPSGSTYDATNDVCVGTTNQHLPPSLMCTTRQNPLRGRSRLRQRRVFSMHPQAFAS
jgi:hypothetical protein